MFLEWAAIFFLFALGAGAFAFTGIIDATAIAKTLFHIFLVISVVLLLAGLARQNKLRRLYGKMVR